MFQPMMPTAAQAGTRMVDISLTNMGTATGPALGWGYMRGPGVRAGRQANLARHWQASD